MRLNSWLAVTSDGSDTGDSTGIIAGSVVAVCAVAGVAFVVIKKGWVTRPGLASKAREKAPQVQAAGGPGMPPAKVAAPLTSHSCFGWGIWCWLRTSAAGGKLAAGAMRGTNYAIRWSQGFF